MYVHNFLKIDIINYLNKKNSFFYVIINLWKFTDYSAEGIVFSTRDQRILFVQDENASERFIFPTWTINNSV